MNLVTQALLASISSCPHCNAVELNEFTSALEEKAKERDIVTLVRGIIYAS